MSTFNLNSISKERPILMGIATIFIICCHAPHWCDNLPGLISKSLMMGYVGVDIFLLISGIGLFYSWKYQKESPVTYTAKWYVRRFKRLLVPYLVISIPIYATICYLDGYTWYYIIENVSTISYWTHHLGAWYVAMLIPLYLLTPLLFWCLTGKYRWVWFSFLVILCYILAIIHLNYPSNKNDIMSNLSFIIFRLPSFFLGICMGSYVKSCKEISLRLFMLIILFSMFFSYSLYKLQMPFEMFLSISIVLGVCMFFNLAHFKGMAVIRKINMLMGEISLESYLFNIFLPLLLIRIDYNIIYPGLNRGNYCMYLLTIVLGILLSYLVRFLYKKT